MPPARLSTEIHYHGRRTPLGFPRPWFLQKPMLTYNTHLDRLTLPEYGRNIQRMVDHCLSIPDRRERTLCAHSIVRAMGNLFPELRAAENEHKLWDHLAIMSDFMLDIDYPCEVIQQADLQTPPDTVPYSGAPFRFRHYGRITQQMIEKAAAMPAGPDRDRVVMLLANHMKKQMLAVNPDGVDDQKIFNDLAELSRGAILLDPAVTHLHQFRELPQPATGKKKKKKQ